MKHLYIDAGPVAELNDMTWSWNWPKNPFSQ